MDFVFTPQRQNPLNITAKSQNSDFLQQEFRIKSGQSAVHIVTPSKYRLQQDEYYEKVHLQLEQIIQTNSELETELFVLQDVELMNKMQASIKKLKQ